MRDGTLDDHLAGEAASGDPCELQFRHLLDKLPAAAYTCDGQGLITYFNQRAVEVWGRAPKLNDAVDRFCGSSKLFSVDGAPIAHENCWMALALKTGQEFNGQEIVIERPYGSRVNVLAHANPIHDKSGRVIGAVNVLVDISERRRAEEAQSLMAAIVESSDDAIVSKTLDGRILSWNTGAQRLFGYTPAEAIGSSITMIIPPERHDEEVDVLARLRRGERIDHYETVRVAKDGGRIDISLTISPVRDRTGRIVAASKVARDITPRKRAEATLVALNAQLREGDRRKDEFLAVLAHELRNPLAPISNALQILRLSNELSPAGECARGIMERQVNYLVRLVDDLLEVSRITRGKVELRRELVELVAVIGSAIETSRPLIEEAGHQLAIAVSTESIVLEADPVRLAQAVTNLLNNAAKYTNPGGQIWLAVRRENDEAMISVRDNGVGISADMLPKVFKMFAQVDGTLNRAQGGLGIGLTLAKNVVELHGGRIEATSGGAGKGSEFIIHLPVAKEPRLGVTVNETRCGPLALPRRRILVVDDQRAAVYTLATLLESMGQQVCTAFDAAHALEHARSQRPDLVISDIGMPNIDGYEFARHLRKVPGMERVTLVALTGYGQDSDRQRAKEAGFDDHLVKPVSVDSLRKLLTSLPSPRATDVGQPG
jgi:two-component system, chemotaxis family, CheB/CheR fusion protein